MDEFDKAEIRAEKRKEKAERYRPPVENPYGFKDEPVITSATVHLPKVKAPVKRTNEMAVTIYVDGKTIDLMIRANLNDIVPSQRNKQGFTEIFKVLSTKLGRVEIT